MDGEGAGELALDDTNLVIRAAPDPRRRTPGVQPHARLAPAQADPAGRPGWPAAAPTRRPPWSPATRSGAPGCRRDELAAIGRRHSAPTCRSSCSAAPRSAPAGARRSARCWPPDTPGTGWWRSPTTACPPRHVYRRARPAPRGRAARRRAAGAHRRDLLAALRQRRRRGARRGPRQRPAGGRAVAAPGAAPHARGRESRPVRWPAWSPAPDRPASFLCRRRRRAPTRRRPADAGPRSRRPAATGPASPPARCPAPGVA